MRNRLEQATALALVIALVTPMGFFIAPIGGVLNCYE
jgi:hypothetical protein